MGKVRVTAIVLLVLTTACGAFARVEELPPPLAPTNSSEPLENKHFRIWPRSAQVEEGVEYVYETGHCGLTYDLDFDGSFWDAVEPDDYEHGDNYPFLINYDKGYITLVAEGEATYEASTGEVAKLRRIDGPVVIGGCA